MSKSPKKRLSRAEHKRRLQLKEQKDRIESRLAADIQFQGAVPESFVHKHIIEILFVILACAGFLVYRLNAPVDPQSIQAQENVTTKLLNRSFDWEFKYPYGYKILALTETEIIQTSYDTLPDGLVINWKEIKISVIEANAQFDQPESLKFEMFNMNYPSKEVAGASISASVSREIGSTARLAIFGDLDFIVEIIEEKDGYLYCLLGLTLG